MTMECDEAISKTKLYIITEIIVSRKTSFQKNLVQFGRLNFVAKIILPVFFYYWLILSIPDDIKDNFLLTYFDKYEGYICVDNKK